MVLRSQHITGNYPEWRPKIVPVEGYRNWLCVPKG
jgi:hypothetical protein